MTTQPATVSVVSPLNPAIDRVKRVLFQPFNPAKWFALGFCAWLAGLGERGGFHGNYNFFSGRGGNRTDFRHSFDRVRDYVMDNLSWILPLAIALTLIGFALGVLFLWLNSRGRFMFLHCVALDKAEVAEPWHQFAHQANSLFWFRLVLGLTGMVLTLPLVVIAGFSFFRMFLHGAWSVGGIFKAAILVAVMFLIGIVFATIKKLTMDFVVPIMFLRGKRCWESWHEFSGLLKHEPGEFFLYLLFQIVIAMAIGIIVLFLVLITCCIAGCVMALPYLGTVLLLPLLVFKRSYSLYYFAQYGREYDVFPPVAGPPTGTVPPVL